MKWSSNQTAIFDWIKAHADQPHGSLIVEAVAGSGKTTTIVEGANYIPQGCRSVFLAFNKSIAEQLAKKLPSHFESKTINGLGYAACRNTLGNIRVDGYKVRNIAEQIIEQGGYNTIDVTVVAKMVGYAKSHGLAPSNIPNVKGLYTTSYERWLTLMERFEVEYDGDLQDLFLICEQVLTKNIQMTNVVDFDDQLYLPVVMNMPCSKYDWLIVDEAQDVSHVQRALLKKSLAPNGHLIAVGDAGQAIYGFRGADSESLASIAKEFSADRLPLSVTYRCPVAVVRMAQEFVPHLEAAPNAAEGHVEHLHKYNAKRFTAGDMILCRNTKPLIAMAFALIARGVGARVMGRDIGAGLVNLIKKRAKRITDAQIMIDVLDEWRHKQVERAMAKSEEAKADRINDQVDSILAVVDSTGATTVKQVIDSIERLFNSNTGVTLSTVHKAKGLEADTVYILEPALMPSKYARQDWQLQQEHNLMYVAYTRALKELYFITLKNLSEE